MVLRTLKNLGVSRFGVEVDIEFCANLLQDEQNKKPKSQIIKEFVYMLTQLNTLWCERVKEYLQESMRNMEDEIRYNRLQLRNIRVEEEEGGLVQRYFTDIVVGDETFHILNGDSS